MTTKTTPRNFGGANIKGTPAMRAKAVRSDLELLLPKLDIMGLQEFRWPWYWDELEDLFGDTYKSFPTMDKGLNSPVLGAQAVVWDNKLVHRKKALVVPSFDFNVDTSGIMENRWYRSVLLDDIETGIECWYGSGHNVVSGDSETDSEKRKMLLRQNLERLDDFLTTLRNSGHPIVFEIDANINTNSWAYDDLLRILKKHGGRIQGPRGVEFLWVCDGTNGTKVNVLRRWEISNGLNTDHEVRCIRHELIRK